MRLAREPFAAHDPRPRNGDIAQDAFRNDPGERESDVQVAAVGVVDRLEPPLQRVTERTDAFDMNEFGGYGDPVPEIRCSVMPAGPFRVCGAGRCSAQSPVSVHAHSR